MIATLRGTLFSKRPDRVIVDVNGVGYALQVPVPVLSELPPEGSGVFLHVYTYVREDAIQLYGFGREEDRNLFTILIGLSGVGPRLAMSILSTSSFSAFYRAVETEDVSSLCRVPGLGKKTAQRLILELRGKLPSDVPARTGPAEDALSALVNLGYRRADAEKALAQVSGTSGEDIADMLKKALQYLSGDK